MTRAGEESGRGPTIPGLIVSDAVQPMSALPDLLAPDVEVCHDARGGVLAYCSVANGTLRIDMPDVASFYFESDADDVRAVRHRSLSPGFILDTYEHCVLPLLLPALGTEVLHASGVAGMDGVVALCGESSTGKSTIAVGLARRGYVLFADDAVAVDTAEPRPMAIPLPFAVRLRPDSARFFGGASEGGGTATAARVSTEPAPLAMLCLLRRAQDVAAPVAVERLDAASACEAALAHAYCFSVNDAARKRRTVQNYLTIGTRVPVYEIRFRPGLQRLSMVLDAIEELVGCVATAPR